jgi:hypothetical protein
VAPLMPRWRDWHPMSLLFGMCGLAMVVDTAAFAATYGHLEVIPASLFVKGLFMVAAGVIFGARRPRDRARRDRESDRGVTDERREPAGAAAG